MRHLLAAVTVVLATGCVSISEVGATADRAGCAVGEAMVETKLFLGLNKPGGEVSETEFAQFIEQDVTPRWREGYTVLEGAGLWYSEQRRMTDREKTRVLVRLHDGSAAASAGIEAIRAAYIQRFAQEAVLRIDHPACADF